MTQLSLAKDGIITEEMKTVAKEEGHEPESIRKLVQEGKIVIPKNKNHDFRVKGIGYSLRTKVNANIGSSKDHLSLEEELEKLKIAVVNGTDSVMDLSTGGDLDHIRAEVIENSCVMVGSVPIYQAATEILEKGEKVINMEPEHIFKAIEKHAESGIDYVTVHCGVTREAVKYLHANGRIGGIVSRGGSILAAWMQHNNKENPLFEFYDDLLNIAFKYDVTLSLGDGLRPGAIADATDKPQIEELVVLGELAKRAKEKGVQTMIEGPGHVPLNQIEANVILEKKLCDGAPFYVLGPLTTDLAPGYDHITSAIGGAIASAAGADFLCYVTPAEHLKLPDTEDVRMGVIAARIAAHSGDIAKGVKGAVEKDNEMSLYRKNLDWEGMYKMALDPFLARKRRSESENYDKEVCTMCGRLCSININKHLL